MKIIKTLNLPTENRNIYTVKIRKNVFAEVMEITEPALLLQGSLKLWPRTSSTLT